MSYDLSIPTHLVAAYDAGEVVLMETAAGATTALVDATSGAIRGQARLVKAVGEKAAESLRSTGSGNLAVVIVAAVSGAVIAGAGTWFVLHRRIPDKDDAEKSRTAHETVLDEAEAIVMAEAARFRHVHLLSWLGASLQCLISADAPGDELV